jgi:hypothetical protein
LTVFVRRRLKSASVYLTSSIKMSGGILAPDPFAAFWKDFLALTKGECYARGPSLLREPAVLDGFSGHAESSAIQIEFQQATLLCKSPNLDRAYSSR